jgi:Subtilase family
MRRTKLLQSRLFLMMFLIFALLGISILAAQGAPPAQGPLPGIADQKLTNVSQDLLILYQEYRAYIEQDGSEMPEFGNSLLPIISDRVVINAVASGDTNALLADLEALGLQNSATYGRMVSGQLPIYAIADLSTLDSLNFVRPAYAITRVGLVTSQGDVAMNSDDARVTWSVDGAGITVGILSDSYDCAPTPITDAATDVANGDLPAGIVVLDDSACPGKDEGRAMMQIIADVAPGANQAFRTAFNGQADFATGIEELAAAGANVIVDDIGYFDEPFFQDGIIAQAVDNVVGMGVAYFSAAGNVGRKSYESAFDSSGLDPNDDPHDFDPGPGVDIYQSVTIPEGATVSLSLQWDQPFFSVSGSPGAANDLDICIVDDPVTTLLACSTNANVGTDPLEILNFTNPGSGTAFNILITKNVSAGGPDPGLMKYVDFREAITINEYDTSSSTIVGHPNATGAVAVGAAPYFLTPEFGTDPAVLETFSSGGGTPILFATDGTPLTVPETRLKPLIVAPDNGNTTFFGVDIPDPGDGSDVDVYPNFLGTSAAAPHAAAVAALLMEAGECLSPANLVMFLGDTALDMDSLSNPGFPDGFDDDSGYGLIDADAALTLLNNNPIDCSNVVYLPTILNNYDSSELLQNGDFDTGSFAPWQILGSPVLTVQEYYSAPYSARLGGTNNATDYVSQEVTIPANATQVTLDFWYRVSGSDPDLLCYLIVDSGFNNDLAGDCLALSALAQNQWINFPYVISGSELALLLGQPTVWVSFQVGTDATNPSTVWVDDVSFKVTATGP